MNRLSLIFLLLPSFTLKAQITGKWKTIDDATGEAKAIVEIFERNDRFYGKILKTFPKPGKPADPICDKCDPADARYRQKIIGMEILRDLRKNGTFYEEGNILDPENGKVYRCKIWREGNELKVRGYWGPFWRTQTWLKAE
ncbi:MAG: hypothetical protein KatS3mg032_0688 [Cyclobacteriaceae bacterium]|nr:MAG: hypothetical protein KatS3mg032_0688 [Cyclobacteriaceae bacterium]